MFFASVHMRGGLNSEYMHEKPPMTFFPAYSPIKFPYKAKKARGEATHFTARKIHSVFLLFLNRLFLNRRTFIRTSRTIIMPSVRNAHSMLFVT